MGRKRRRRIASRKPPNRNLILAQVAVLVLALVILLAYRDRVGTTASLLVDAVGSEDIAVESAEGGLDSRITDLPDAGLDDDDH